MASPAVPIKKRTSPEYLCVRGAGGKFSQDFAKGKEGTNNGRGKEVKDRRCSTYGVEEQDKFLQQLREKSRGRSCRFTEREEENETFVLRGVIS